MIHIFIFMKSCVKLFFFSLLTLFSSCERSLEEITVIDIETPEWAEETHGNSVDPNYSIVFSQSEVKRIDITIDPDDWNDILADLASMPHGGPGQPMGTTFDPIWVPCDFFFDGKQWYKVGIRVKGNSSLQSTYMSGIRKFSFKLDFDEFEDTYPAIKNQRFYGFKQLNLNNNFDDKSELREKVTADLFREFGVPSAHTSFYELSINFNGESQYFGLYTLVEEVDNTVIKTQFISNDGNLYKPENRGATFAYGSFNTTDFYKKTNEDFSDWSDVENLYTAIHNPDRTTNPEEWRSQLESILDMEQYLKWLAANTVIQNWDTYGRMTHNYYLYNDPLSQKFVWIPWDNNEALQEGKMQGAISIDLSDVDNNWPLISYIASDEVYYNVYKQFTKEFVQNVFDPATMESKYNQYSSLIRESVGKEELGYTFLQNGLTDFDDALVQLKQHVNDRYNAAINLE